MDSILIQCDSFLPFDIRFTTRFHDNLSFAHIAKQPSVHQAIGRSY